MDFPYPRLHFGIRFLVLTGLLASILYLMTINDINSAWLAGFIAVCFLAIVLVSATPLFTSHCITDDGIRLRQGLLFNTLLPFGEIKSVESTETKLWAFGLFPAGDMGRIVFANSNRNLVSIKLKARRRFPMLLLRSGKEIIIDLNNPSEFVKAANDKLQR
ncbi:MAG: hypothetical protein KKH41_00755 [Candidatus Thermoplasmatota archaeon]|nr:hypothetical protein [Euryarchaeota archaeon]MBU4032236.1 hypothetical protein [Candidatus Thermoplasmatota archaeon]MBU4071924.1 hypothetical protein [Candidatus Thermoplasmatota archaeon]MBU4144203.1 hypothetical protein [Candidatus Thermoplasmatota archaeon]MBU4591091.1 hypothetical protein [Candidatus Thermoplasmatota archaeon]